MGLKLNTPLKVETGKVVAEVKTIDDLKIVALSFNDRHLYVKLSDETGAFVRDIELPRDYLMANIQTIKGFINLIYNGIKTIPGYEGTIS